MSDFTVRLHAGVNPALVRSAIVGSLMAAGLYEDADYTLVVSEQTDPLAIEPTGDEASGKQLFFLNKLYESVQAKAIVAGETEHEDGPAIAWTLSMIGLELRDGPPNRRRASAIIDALKEVEGML